MRWLVPLGWFVPVTPGTRQVTVGGAIASDIHGKNHHRAGSWCSHVEAMTIVTPAGGKQRITPSQDPDLFWATAGGMGLTGIVLDATIRLKPIETSQLLVDTDRTRDLESTFELMATTDHLYDYTVAWIDLETTGASMGRSVVTRGSFATLDALREIAPRRAERPLDFHARALASTPPVVPPKLLNHFTLRAFNEAWYRKAPKHRVREAQTIGKFFHPLDMLRDWNRLYGRLGMLQWQPVVPFEALDTHAVDHRAALHGHVPVVRDRAEAHGAGQPRTAVVPEGRAGRSTSTCRSRPSTGSAPCSTTSTSRWWTPAVGCTWPRTAASGPSCCRSCTRASTSGSGCGPRSTPTACLRSDLGRRLGLV